MKTTYFMMEPKIPKRVILPGSRRCTLISKSPDTTSVQIFGQINFMLGVEQNRLQTENNLNNNNNNNNNKLCLTKSSK